MLGSILNKLFLIKEIKSQDGVLHFRRWRFFKTPWFSLNIHQILESDLDDHLHDHPWSFTSFIFKGGYLEHRSNGTFKLYRTWSWNRKPAPEFHKLKLTKGSTWTFTIMGAPYKSWGYLVNGTKIDHQTYRMFKNNGTLYDIFPKENNHG